MADADDPPRVGLIAALVTAIAATGAVLAIAVIHQRPRDPVGPVSLATVPAPHAADPACPALLAALPRQLGDYRRATIAPPAPDGAAAWTADTGEPVILRCGLERPSGFTLGSPIQAVDQVQWFAVRSADRSTWYTVDRPVYVALTLPPGSGPAPIQQLSDLIEITLPAVPIKPAPVG